MRVTSYPASFEINTWAIRLFLLLAVAGLLSWWYVRMVRPFLLLISDQGGPFYLSFSPADIDGDGDLDVLVHNMRNPEPFVAWSGGAIWTNQGNLQGGTPGQFSYRLNDIEGGQASTLADIDSDDDPDVLVFDGSRLILGLNQAGVQAGEPGVFKLWTTIPEPDIEVGEYGVLLAGDIDADGRPDAVLLGWGQAYLTTSDKSYSPNVSWTWLNTINSHRVYSEDTAILPALNGLSVVDGALADWDQDGDLDLLAAASPTQDKSMRGSAVYLLVNDGAGVFSSSGQPIPARDSTSLAVGDLDGDGDPDALIGYQRGALILINQGGGLAAAPESIGGRNTRGVNLPDLDGDGDLDALVVGVKQVELWWNDGLGHFSCADQRIPAREDQDLTTGDFNNDGRVDIFVARYDKSAQVWWNDGKGGFSAGSADR